MFGVLMAGKMVQTNFEEVTPNRFVANIDADSANHIVVFLTGVKAFPEGTAGSIYFSLPSANAAPTWHLLGNISNEKPSTVLKVSSLTKSPQPSQELMVFGQQNIQHNALLGISIEPICVVNQQSASVENEETSSMNLFGLNILENFVNFTTSFAIPSDQLLPNANETYIPLSTMSNWYNTFIQQLKQNPNFWRS